ncbi:MAG: hypothetical protein DWH91_05395 [Planctomycetota bacterium]|nr:MAG: hypothetical protein DWH91_05395 [Planctomycetota bacterium]
MDKLRRVSPEVRDNFVAYLDGELPPPDIKQLEQILADSPVARKDVEALVRTYELLDLLPRPQATVEFTQKTMATVKLSDLKTDITQTAWYKQFQLGLAGGLGWLLVAGVALVAYLGTNRWVPSEDDLKLRDLQVIKNIDNYSQAGSYDFIERLERSPKLMQEIREEVRTRHGR